MRRGFLLAMAGSLLALLGPVVLPFVTVIEEETSLAGYQLDTGLAAIGLALMGLGLAAWFGRQRLQRGGWVLAGFAVAQLGLMAWTYADVWALVPCMGNDMAMCDAATGGLMRGTLVTLDWGMAVGVMGALVALLGGGLVLLSHPEYGKAARFLRVGLRWQGETVSQEVYFRRRPVTVGEADFAAFQLPAGGLRLHHLLTPIKGDDEAWYLTVPPGMRGDGLVGGQRRELGAGDVVRIHRGDAGIIEASGDLSLSFDFMAAETAVLGGSANDDGGMAVSFTLAAGMVCVLLMSALMQHRRSQRIGVEEQLEARVQEMIEVQVATLEEPEPEEEIEGEEPDTTAKKADNEEGRFGDPDKSPTKESQVPKRDAPLDRPFNVDNIGITAELGGARALQGALGTIMAGDTTVLNQKIAQAMAGEGTQLVIGHGSNGMGFKGIGTGGGGEGGFGRIHGQGQIDTGGGTGRRAILGRRKRKIARRVDPTKTGRLQSKGFCERGNLVKVFRRKASAFRSCYERQLMSHPSLKGKITVSWVVDLEGKVQHEQIKTNTLRNAAVGDCVLRYVRRMRFKKPDGGVCVVQFPLAFSPG